MNTKTLTMYFGHITYIGWYCMAVSFTIHLILMHGLSHAATGKSLMQHVKDHGKLPHYSCSRASNNHAYINQYHCMHGSKPQSLTASFPNAADCLTPVREKLTVCLTKYNY